MEANNDYRVLDLKRHNFDAWEQSLMNACSRLDAKHFLRGTVLEPTDEIKKADFLYKRYQVWMRLRFSTQEIREESGLAGYLLDEMDPFKVYSFIRYNFGPDQSHTATQTEALTPISYPLPGIDAVTGVGTDKVSSFVLCHKFFNMKIANYDTPKAFLDEFIRVASQLSTTDCALPDRVKSAMLATQFRQLDPRGMTQLYYAAGRKIDRRIPKRQHVADKTLSHDDFLQARESGKLHQTLLPSSPLTVKQALGSWLFAEWKQTIQDHLDTHKDSETWVTVSKPPSLEHQVIDCKWIFTYKVNADGYLTKCKARLVARSDQYKHPDEDTYAATLTLRSLRVYLVSNLSRAAMSIQLDVVNAYVHAKLYDAEMNKITYRELLVICHKKYTDVLYNDCNDYDDYNDSPG